MLTRPFWILEDSRNSEADVARLEQEFSLQLPQDLREHLLRFAGSDIDISNEFEDPDGTWDCVFYADGFDDEEGLRFYLRQRDAEHMFPVFGTERGRAVYYDLTSGEMRMGTPGYPVVSRSLAAFLDLVAPETD